MGSYRCVCRPTVVRRKEEAILAMPTEFLVMLISVSGACLQIYFFYRSNALHTESTRLNTETTSSLEQIENERNTYARCAREALALRQVLRGMGYDVTFTHDDETRTLTVDIIPSLSDDTNGKTSEAVH